MRRCAAPLQRPSAARCSAPWGSNASDGVPRKINAMPPEPLSLTAASTTSPFGVRWAAPPTSVPRNQGADQVVIRLDQLLGTLVTPVLLVRTAQNTRSPHGRKPSSASRRTVSAIAAVLVQHVDRPASHTSPSTISPPNGSRRHPSASSAGTTSVWPTNASDGAAASVPRSVPRAIRARRSPRATRRRHPDPRRRHATWRRSPTRRRSTTCHRADSRTGCGSTRPEIGYLVTTDRITHTPPPMRLRPEPGG